MAPSTVRATLEAGGAAGLGWPLPEELSDAALEAGLYASRRTSGAIGAIAEPDWAASIAS